MSDSESTHSDLNMDSSSEFDEAEFYELYLCPHCPEGVFGFKNFETHIRKKHTFIQFNDTEVEMRLICLKNIETVLMPKKKTKNTLKERTGRNNMPKKKIKTMKEKFPTLPEEVKMEIICEEDDFETEDVPIKARNMPKLKTENITENIPKKKNTKNISNKKTKNTLKKKNDNIPTRVSTRNISQTSSLVTHSKTNTRLSSQASESKPVVREYVCSHCPAKLYGMKAYRDHVKSVHDIENGRINSSAPSTHNNTKSRKSSQAFESKSVVREYVCSECFAKSYGLKAYRDHVKSVHNIKFTRKNSRASSSSVTHNNTKSKREYVCSLCPAKLYGMKSYRDHVKSVHDVKIERIFTDYQSVNEDAQFNKNLSSYSDEKIYIKEEIS